MASQNDIGSKHQQISNPLRPFGLIELTTGLIIVLIGIDLLMNVSAFSSNDNIIKAWIAAISGLSFTIHGGFIAFSGMFKSFSLVIGRNDPKSLSYNCNNANENCSNMQYNDIDLYQMLMSRQNKTFVEPRCWLESLFFSLFRKMFFLPLPYRNVMQGFLSAIIKTLIILICYSILKFMTITGLLTGSNVIFVTSLYILFWVLKLFFIWKDAYLIFRNRISPPDNLSFKKLILTIAYAILIPSCFLALLNYVMIPNDSEHLSNTTSFVTSLITGFDLDFWFICFALLPVAATIPIFYMGYRKCLEYGLKTEVSERIVNWQESIHPREIFIAVENIAMAKRRYMEVPNRVYAKFEPKLNVESDGNKGDFLGLTIQETQPEWIASKQNKGFCITKYLSVLLSSVLSISMFIIISSYVKNLTFKWSGNFDVETILLTLGLVTTVMLFWLLSKILKGASLLFFSELKFNSLLIYYKTEGTFTESKISMGASYHDSNRSENSVIRSSINQWIVVSKLTTITFLGTTLDKFENARFVMEMDKDDFQINEILKDLKSFVDSRVIVADLAENEQSAKVAEHIMKMNARDKAMSKLACENPEAIVGIDPLNVHNNIVIESGVDEDNDLNNTSITNNKLND